MQITFGLPHRQFTSGVYICCLIGGIFCKTLHSKTCCGSGAVWSVHCNNAAQFQQQIQPLPPLLSEIGHRPNKVRITYY